MPTMEEHTRAMTNRSLRTIQAELEFLADTSLITPQQLSSFLSQLPSQTPLHASLLIPTPSPTPITQATSQPVNALHGEKQSQGSYYAPTPSPAPPAYSTPVPPALGPAPLARATALYAYSPHDAGDLALMPEDPIDITEFMNSDWAKGKNGRTGMEGIFPRSYVNIIDEKSNQGSNYGNMPLAVSQTGGGSGNMTTGNSKFDENGKKFGKKLGNAAIFGAGASIGSNIVNSIF